MYTLRVEPTRANEVTDTVTARTKESARAAGPHTDCTPLGAET